MIWEILEIEQTKDEEAIKTAYRNKLHYVNPEDDQEGFKELRRAYEEALEYASREETESLHNNDEAPVYAGKKDEVDLWIDRIDAIYQDVRTRKDEKKWEELLHDPICDDLDTEIEAAEKLLVFFMSHSYMPQNIWELVDKRFGYMDNYDQLKEKFPENYLEYVKWQIQSSNFIDFELFDGKTDSGVDDYINKLYEIKNVEEERDLKKLRVLLNEISRLEVTHPFTQVEEARYAMMKAEDIENKEGGVLEEKEAECKELFQHALEIMEELDFQYSDNPYIERVYAETLEKNGELDKAMAVYDALLEVSADNYGALLGRAKCIFLSGNAEEAKEKIEDILEDRVQDAESLALLDKVNAVLVKDYEACLEKEMDRDICFKLGWCYYQQKEFEKGIALLDKAGEGEDYDYINLRCRLYLANEDYDKAYPLAKKWLALIENSVDDGSKDMEKRKNRLSLAYFSIGVCIWESVYKKEQSNKKSDAFSQAASYIKRAIEEEKNTLVMLSYMEQLARFYLEAEAYEECIEICDSIIEKDRGFFPAYVHRQKANYELKNAKEVIDDYFACIEIYPQYAPPYVLAAEVFSVFEQYDDVESVVLAAREAGLESDSLELFRIRCLHYKEFSKENVKEALNAIHKLKNRISERTEDDPTDMEDMTELEKERAILYWDLEQTDSALEVIEKYLKENPKSVSMLNLKIDVLSREGRHKEALKACQNLYLLDSGVNTRTRLGICYERAGDYKNAKKYYESAYSMEPQYIPVVRRLMYLYSFLSNKENDLNKCETAIMYATQFIEITNLAEGYAERGNLYIDLYELDKAVEDCRKAIELDPEAYYAYNNLGCALLKLRMVDEAIVPLEQAVEMEPDRDHLPYLNLAECYTLQKEYDKAIQAYKEVLRLHPEAEHIWENIINVYRRKGDYPEVISYYQKKIQRLEERFQKAKLSDRMLWSDKLIQEEECLMELYCELADVYRQAGDKSKAEQYYGKVLERWRKPLKTKISVKHIVKIAEYYRDCGELEKAEKLIKSAYWKMTDADMKSKVWEDLQFVKTTILFECAKQRLAREDAITYFRKLTDRLGQREQILSDKRYLPMYLYNYGIISLCAGDVEEGKADLEQIAECHQCVTCEYKECFEYYFGMGLLAEIEGRIEDAKRFYEKAIEIKGDYPCAERHLRNLQR